MQSSFIKWIRVPVYALLITLIAAYFLIPSKRQNININEGAVWDNYSPELFYKLLTVDAIVSYNDSLVSNKADRITYTQSLVNLVALRFWHRYSHYTFRHNWISYTSGKLVWDDLNAIVIPNDILQYSNAACSQVSIVLAACLKKAGIPYRPVALKGHFALEAMVDGKWYYFDANLAPKIEKPTSLDELIKTGEINVAYRGRLTEEEMKQVFSSVKYGSVNEPLAPNATVFHRVTYPLSVSIPLLLLAFAVLDCWFFIRRKVKLARKKNAASPVKVFTIAHKKEACNY